MPSYVLLFCPCPSARLRAQVAPVILSPSRLVPLYSPIDRCSLCYHLFSSSRFVLHIRYPRCHAATTVAIHHLCSPFRLLYRVFVVGIPI